MYESYPLTKAAPKERFEYFSSLVSELFSPHQCDAPSNNLTEFEGKIEAADIGHLKLAKVSTSALSVSRRPSDVSKICDAPFLVKFQISGEALFSQRGNEAHLRPGDFVICTTAEPYQLKFNRPYQMSVLAISDTTMSRIMRHPDEIIGQRMPGDDPSCGLLSDFVSSVVDKFEALPSSMAERVETNILDLLGGVIRSRSETIMVRRMPASQQRANIKRYICDNLRSRRLNPGTIANEFNVSTRYVHKLFSTEVTTVTRYIRAARLEACREMLLNPAMRSESITDIALHWGFYDLSHMTRAFSEQFGVSPSAMRCEHFKLAKP